MFIDLRWYTCNCILRYYFLLYLCTILLRPILFLYSHIIIYVSVCAEIGLANHSLCDLLYTDTGLKIMAHNLGVLIKGPRYLFHLTFEKWTFITLSRTLVHSMLTISIFSVEHWYIQCWLYLIYRHVSELPYLGYLLCCSHYFYFRHSSYLHITLYSSFKYIGYSILLSMVAFFAHVQLCTLLPYLHFFVLCIYLVKYGTSYRLD